jgi:signal peptidase I
MNDKLGIGETLRTLLYAAIVAITFRTFSYEPFNIPSESMLPNLVIGDYLFVSKLSYLPQNHNEEMWRCFARVVTLIPTILNG